MDSQSIKHLIEEIEDRFKEDWQAASVVQIPDQVICSIPTKNCITLYHSIVNNQHICGYSGYQNFVVMVDATTVGDYSKVINHKVTEKTTT